MGVDHRWTKHVPLLTLVDILGYEFVVLKANRIETYMFCANLAARDKSLSWYLVPWFT